MKRVLAVFGLSALGLSALLLTPRMMRFPRFALAAFAILASLAALVAVTAQSQDRSEAAGVPAFYATALGTKTVNGVELGVHVVVGVEAGQDGRAVAEAALRSLGASPLGRADWGSLVDEVDGIYWDHLYAGSDAINVEYSTALEPFAAKSEFVSAAASWTNVATSRVILAFDSDVTTCPSLVAECGGTLDGANTLGWETLDPGVLGVAWFVNDGKGGTPQEVDIALSLYYNWTSGSSPFAINLETVALHEVGHLLGLAHSGVRKATMYASYTRADTTLHADDIEGISTLYPGSDPNPDPTPDDGGNDWCSTHDETHKAWEKKGCNTP